MMKSIKFTIALVMVMIANSLSAQEFDKKHLLYRITSAENKTVELLGFEKNPREDLIIPEEVSYKGMLSLGFRKKRLMVVKS